MQKFTPQAEQIAARIEPFVAGLLAALMRGFGNAAFMAQQSSGTPAMRHYLHVPPGKREEFRRAWQAMEVAEKDIRGGYGVTKQHVTQFLAPLRSEDAGNLAGPLANAGARDWNCQSLALERGRLRACVAKLHLQANAYAVAVESALACVAIATECEAEDAFCEEETWPAPGSVTADRPGGVGNAVLWSPAPRERRLPREAMARACGQLAAGLREPVAGNVERAARDAVGERSESLWLAYQASASAARGRQGEKGAQADKAAPPADRATIATVIDTFAEHLGQRMAGLAREAVERAYGDAACQRMLQEALRADAGGGAAQDAIARALEAFVLHAALPMAEEIAGAAADAVATLPHGIGPGATANLGPETISQVFQGAAAEELARGLRTSLHAAAVVAVAERAPELCAGLGAQLAAALDGQAGGAAVAR
ncbi:hypothetical protein QMO56_02325 [Roseomonas sp. E05]|uniref:hypothetical protein n=1 Tax=Roseomonas sp. E05 TaxID=3046310 RepID=UPI0024B91F7B|nr:hypothetical protein [Roseomonas sp. E05]MDJ0386937.1 hypothetical protein [Roseomonas sp. E05]